MKLLHMLMPENLLLAILIFFIAVASFSPGLVVAIETAEQDIQFAAPPEPSELTLQQALAFVLEHNPDLKAFSKELRANEATILQAGVLHNPVLGLEASDFGNQRKANAGDRTTTLQIGQLIELGGKRAARIRLAQTDRDLANWDYEAKRIEILTQVTQRFINVLVFQQRETLSNESLQLARQVADTVAKRVKAGKVSPVEETKARLTVTTAEVELEQARRQLAAARGTLSVSWGNPSPQFKKAIGDLEQTMPLPEYEALAGRVRNNPDLARWSTEIARHQAAVAIERTKAVPDVTVTAGVSHFSKFNDEAYMLGISVPIPVFDRNRGGILAANERLSRAAYEQHVVEGRVLADLLQTYQLLEAIYKEIEALRTTLLPGAQSAFDAATKGYQLGKFSFLEVLDAQRTLFQSRAQYLQALADYQRGYADIERLIGEALDT